MSVYVLIVEDGKEPIIAPLVCCHECRFKGKRPDGSGLTCSKKPISRRNVERGDFCSEGERKR